MEVENLTEIKTAHPTRRIHPLIAQRWSPYSFSSKPVPDQDLAALFEAASWAASSFNEQPWRYFVAAGADDPNAAIYADAKRRAEAFGVEVVEFPSPGLITRADFIEPASYANFAITTNLVVVPTFGSTNDHDAVAAVAALFPDRATIGLAADAVLAGGGGFHCASQQMPTLTRR